MQSSFALQRWISFSAAFQTAFKVLRLTAEDDIVLSWLRAEGNQLLGMLDLTFHRGPLERGRRDTWTDLSVSKDDSLARHPIVILNQIAQKPTLSLQRPQNLSGPSYSPPQVSDKMAVATQNMPKTPMSAPGGSIKVSNQLPPSYDPSYVYRDASWAGSKLIEVYVDLLPEQDRGCRIGYYQEDPES